MRLSPKIICFILLFSFTGYFACQKEKITEFQGDSIPIITSVKIFPENPDKESELHLYIQSRDPKGNDVAFQYQWLKNNKEIPGENRSILKGESLEKGNLISVRVVPIAGNVEGKPFLSEPVKVINSPPGVQEVGIEPKVPYATDELKVFVRSSDLDGDFVNYTYQWEKNGMILSEEKKGTLERGRYKKGDSIAVFVAPGDGEISGKTGKSDPIVIANSPPVIVSSPPTNVDKDILAYQVRANDADEDPISFILKSGPKGMEIDKNTGFIRWEIRKEDSGSHLIEIEASDNEGARSFQRFTLTVGYK